MLRYYAADDIRAAERPVIAAAPPDALMRRAAHGLALVVARELRERTGGIAGRRVTLLVGSGDNGGDALWAGTELARRGVAVRAVLLDPRRFHRAAAEALRRAGGRVTGDLGPQEGPAAPDLVVDGIVGLSGRGPLRPAAAELVDRVHVPIVAVDLPSGVDADTGVVDGPAVTAAVTVTFGALRNAHALNPQRCGRIELVPIGIDPSLPALSAYSDADIGRLWPVPGPHDDKYTQGVVGIVAGSAHFPGAAVLSTVAAVAATSGMVRYVGSAADRVLDRRPEVVATTELADAGRVQAWVVGPGAGTDAAARDRLAQILSRPEPVLVDADGLTVLADAPELLRGRTGVTVLTPHDREFERVVGRSPGPDRVASVVGAAADLGVHLLLKGNVTIIADPAGTVVVNDAGSSWPATAGSGDVLSGLSGALLAAGLDPLDALGCATRAHSVAAIEAARAPGPAGAPVRAGAIAESLPTAIALLRAAV